MNEERGFTLIEVVVSIFAIVLMSSFIVRMFLVSAQLNQKVYLVDQAGAYASQWVEEFKADPEAVKLTLQQSSALQPAQDTYVLYYDSDWQLVGLPEATYRMTVNWQKNSEYSMTLPSVPGIEANITQGIIDFQVAVDHVERSEITSSLATYAAQKYTKYFPDSEEAVDERHP